MAGMEPRRHITGVVVSAGKMINTVKVRIPKQVWNKRVQKYYSAPETLLVSDPTNSTREGDVVALEGGRRISKHVRHVIAGVIAPMGPPMSERAPVPSAAERLAAVEASRAAKDIRQAARGRWPAIVRIREREARAAMRAEDGSPSQEAQPMTLDTFVKIYRRRKHDEDIAQSLVPDFLRVAGFRVLQGEVPLNAQIAALLEAKSNLIHERAKLEERIQEGRRQSSPLRPERTTMRPDAVKAEAEQKEGLSSSLMSLQEEEELSKQKLDLWRQIYSLERSIAHFIGYMKEVDPKNEERKQALKNNPIEWYDLVTALSMSHWEQNIAALDLWGTTALNRAGKREMSDVLARAGIAPENAANMEGTALQTSEIDEQALPSEAAVMDTNPEIEVATAASTQQITEQQAAASVVEEAAVEAQEHEAQDLAVGEKEMPLTNDPPHLGPPNERQQADVRKAQHYTGKGLENEAQVEEEKAQSITEQQNGKSGKEKKAGGLWNIFGRR